MPTFTSVIGLQNYIESACQKAVESTAQIAQQKLHDCINEQYYNDPEFYPYIYQRTRVFLESAAYQMLTSKSAKIFIDLEGMHYSNGFNPWQVVTWGTESKHGGDAFQTPTEDFWSVFIKWCNDNLLNTLKQELRKQKLNVL